MNVLAGRYEIDQIEVTCSLLEAQPKMRPSLVVELGLQERSPPPRVRELYLPLHCNFLFAREDGTFAIIGPGIDLTAYPATGLADITVPRQQPMRLSSGVGLDPVTLSALSTAVRRIGSAQLAVNFSGLLLNNVRTAGQRMFGFTPSFRFSLDLDTWNLWLTRWRDAYSPSDLPTTVPPDVAVDFAEGVRCFSVEAYRGCVVLLRRSMESAATEKGGRGGNLLTKLQSLVDGKVLSGADHALASGVRMFGNYGAHPSTDGLSSVSREDAELVLQVCRQLLKKMFPQ